VHQDLQDAPPQTPVGLHRRVGRHLDLRPHAGALATQPRLLDPHLAVRQRDDATLAAMPADLPARMARMSWTGHLLGTHQEDGLQGAPAHHIDHLVDRRLRPLHEVQHGQEELAFLRQKLRPLPAVLRVRNLVGSTHVVAPFALVQLNHTDSADWSRHLFLTFNYGWDSLTTRVRASRFLVLLMSESGQAMWSWRPIYSRSTPLRRRYTIT